jgi:uncharacterized protein YggE
MTLRPLAFALALAAAPMAISTAARAQDASFRATTLNLSAFGETAARPDVASITTGVQIKAPTAAEAMRQNAERMSAVVAVLKARGIAERDIQTSGLNLSPQYVYEQNKPPRPDGYQASNQVTVTVRDLTRLGQAVDAVVAAGANEINGVAFGLSAPGPVEDTSRRAAVAALTAKANLYAQASGYKIARLISLSESGGYSPQPPQPKYMVRAMMSDGAESTPVQGGELKVRIEVQAAYELVK